MVIPITWEEYEKHQQTLSKSITLNPEDAQTQITKFTTIAKCDPSIAEYCLAEKQFNFTKALSFYYDQMQQQKSGQKMNGKFSEPKSKEELLSFDESKKKPVLESFYISPQNIENGRFVSPSTSSGLLISQPQPTANWGSVKSSITNTAASIFGKAPKTSEKLMEEGDLIFDL